LGCESESRLGGALGCQRVEYIRKRSMLEVCIDTLRGAREAIRGGAQRIEISCRLEVGGVTPDEEFVYAVRKEVDVPLIALVRCREGDFQYGAEEKTQMLDEVRRMLALGCDGVAVGGCDSRLRLDEVFLRDIAEVARRGCKNCELVVHRVFDAVPDKRKSLEQLVSMGYDRILTSGGGLRAVDSLETLRDLQQCGQGRMCVLPAGGIYSGNALRILQVTGCRELHGSFTSKGEVIGLLDEEGQGVLSVGGPICDEVRRVRDLLDCWLGQS
jgi:copper homeostasis protein